ncbi:dUTP diphosphatase [Candidatus Hepatincolaceae symbiont of Richtersius coronifer]
MQNFIKVKICFLDHYKEIMYLKENSLKGEKGVDYILPTYATSGSAGMDLRALLKEDITLAPQTSIAIPTGISIELSAGIEASIRSRSGLALNHNVIVLNSPGTIDSDYRGEIKVILMNLGKKGFLISNQDKIAQIVISPYLKAYFEIVSSLPNTTRGNQGFGSTGIK